MPSWRSKPAKETAAILRRWYVLIVENADDLGKFLTAEQDKPLAEAKAEIISNAAYLELFAEEAKRIEGYFMAGSNPSQRIGDEVAHRRLRGFYPLELFQWHDHRQCGPDLRLRQSDLCAVGHC